MRLATLAMTLIVTVLATVDPVSARGRRRRPPPIDPEILKVVEPLLKQLGADSFEVREKATLDLMNLGARAQPALLPAALHPWPEVRARVRRILLHYRELERRESLGVISETDWPTLKREPGRRASAGPALRKEPEVAWHRVLPDVMGSPYFDSPILASKDRLYVVARTGQVTAIDRTNGRTVWERDLEEKVFAGPVLASGILYVPGRSLSAIDIDSGKLRWRWRTDYGVSATPLVHDGRVYAVERGEKLVSLDPASGDVVWKVRVGATSCSPVIAGDYVLLGNTEGMKAFSLKNGSRRWTFKTDWPVSASPATLKDSIVFGDVGRNLYAVTKERGKLVWHRRIPEGTIMESPAVYGDLVFFSTSGATFRAISARDGVDRWMRTLGYYLQSSPCVADGVAYLSSGPRVHALECATGDDVWRLPLPGRFSAPILLDGTLYVVALDGVVVALR